MLRPCLVAGLAAAFMASACAGQGEPITGAGGNSGPGSAGNGGPGTAGNGGPGTGGDTGTAGANPGGGSTGMGGGPLVMPPKGALTPAMACTTSGTPGPRKLWRLSGPQFAASVRAIFNDT